MADSDPIGGAPPATEGSPPRPSLETKYSASTQAIIDRLRGVGGIMSKGSPFAIGSSPLEGGLPPGYEETRRAMMQNYTTSASLVTTTTSTNGDASRAATPVAKKQKSVVGAKVTPSTAREKAGNGTPRKQNGTPNSGSTRKTGGRGRGRGRAGHKRKRVKEESESPEDTEISDLGDSESDEAAFVPTQTLSGRKVVRPTQFTPPVTQEAPVKKKGPAPYNKKTGRNVEQALCKRCSRGNSPNTNQIVFCDSCNIGWHQRCHDPVISDDVVKDIDAPWFCSICTAKKAARANKGKGAAASPAAKTPAPVLASAPAKITTIPTPVREAEPSKPTGWASMNVEQKRSYLSKFPHVHLLSMMINATTKHPDLPCPLPPSNTQTNTSPYVTSPLASSGTSAQPSTTNVQTLNGNTQHPLPPTSTSGLFSRGETNPGATMNFIRKIQSDGGCNIANSSDTETSFRVPGLNHNSGAPAVGLDDPVFENAMDVDMSLDFDSAPSHIGDISLLNGSYKSEAGPINDTVDSTADAEADAEGEDDSRESTPASPPYPKPGTGLMARLKSDEDSLDWLVGDGEADSAFSQTVL